MESCSVLSFKPLFAHTNTRLKEIMHLFLSFKIPRMPLVPACHNKLNTIKKPFLKKVGNWIGLMPSHELESIEFGIKYFMIFSYQIITREDKKISSRF